MNYAEGMISTCEPQWIEVNNHALAYFGGVPTSVVCDNCKQAVTANKDWIAEQMALIPNTLTSVNGIGPVYSAGIIAEIGDINRFPNQASLAKYAGLSAAERQLPV